MTVKSPFYNKPSTLTSVDSCHKCPLIPVTSIQSVNQCNSNNNQVEQPKQFPCSNNNKSIIEPCSSSVAKSDNGYQGTTCCSNCGTTTTPLWRRSPLGETICNACGLYFKARNTSRPVWLKRHNNNNNASNKPKTIAIAPCVSQPPRPPLLAPKVVVAAPVSKKPEDTSNLICANCQTTNTPLWRRDQVGQPICNACGLYYKLHSVHRPITMKRSTIKRRKRVTAATMVTTTTHKPIMIHEHRPLLPSIMRPPTPEPDVHNPPPSTAMKGIAYLLNPEVSLPSPPLLPKDDVFATQQQALEAHRNELQREVSNLTSLLSRTTAMLQNIDHVMSEIK